MADALDAVCSAGSSRPCHTLPCPGSSDYASVVSACCVVTIVTICMSCFMTGDPDKEYGTNKPPPTGRVRERSKGDTARVRPLPSPRHDEDLREPLVRRQGSQVSMRVARGSASSRAEGLLFLHGLESNPGSSLQTEEEAGLP